MSPLLFISSLLLSLACAMELVVRNLGLGQLGNFCCYRLKNVRWHRVPGSISSRFPPECRLNLIWVEGEIGKTEEDGLSYLARWPVEAIGAGVNRVAKRFGTSLRLASIHFALGAIR